MHLVRQTRCLRVEAGSIPTRGAIRRSAGHNGASKTPEDGFDSLSPCHGLIVQREYTAFAMQESEFESRSVH